MKKVNSKNAATHLRPTYTRAELGQGVRGKYASQMNKGSQIIILEPDVARAFPTDQLVNETLRMLVKLAKKTA